MGSAGTALAVTGAKAAAAAAVPTIMSATGIVVAGVGTLHGATTAAVASFAATTVTSSMHRPVLT